MFMIRHARVGQEGHDEVWRIFPTESVSEAAFGWQSLHEARLRGTEAAQTWDYKSCLDPSLMLSRIFWLQSLRLSPVVGTRVLQVPAAFAPTLYRRGPSRGKMAGACIARKLRRTVAYFHRAVSPRMSVLQLVAAYDTTTKAGLYMPPMIQPPKWGFTCF